MRETLHGSRIAVSSGAGEASLHEFTLSGIDNSHQFGSAQQIVKARFVDRLLAKSRSPLAQAASMSGLPASLRFGPPGARPGGAATAPRAAPAGTGTGKRRDEVRSFLCYGQVGIQNKIQKLLGMLHGSAPAHTLSIPQAPLDDAAAWRAECERAAPQLTIAVPADAGADSRDWRPLLERALAALGSLQAAAPAAQAASAASAGRLTSQLEALAAGEAAAGAQLAGLRAEHKAAQEAVTVLQREVDARQDYVGQLQAELAFLNKVGQAS